MDNKKQRLISSIIIIIGFFLTIITLLYDLIVGEIFDIGELQLRIMLLCLAVVYSGLLFRYWQKVKKSFFLIANKLKVFMKRIISTRGRILFFWYTKNRTIIFSVMAIILIFFVLYFINGNRLANTGVLEYFDVFFELDPPRAIDDISGYSADHYRTSVHPLYVIMVNPFGSLFRHIFQSVILGALFINSLFGAIGVGLAYLFFKLYTGSKKSSLLLALLFGLSTSQMILSVIPDTASLAIISLIINYFVFYKGIKNKNTPTVLWVFAGLFTLGVTTTNVIQTLICYYIFLCANSISFQKKVLLSFRLVLSIFLMAFTFSIVQKILYPSAVLFFLPGVYQEELYFISGLLFTQPITKIYQIVKTFFFDSLIAPIPRIIPSVRSAIPHMTFTAVINYQFVGIIAIILLMVIYIVTLKTIIDKKNDYWMIAAISISLLFNFILHSFYGLSLIQPNHIELFLYTGNTTFLIILIISNWFVDDSKLKSIIVLGFIFFMGLNNYLIVNNIIIYYQNYLQ